MAQKIQSFANEVIEENLWQWAILSLIGFLIYLAGAAGLLRQLTDVTAQIVLPTRTQIFSDYQRWERLRQNLANPGATATRLAELEAENASLVARLAELDSTFAENRKLIEESGIEFDRNYRKVGARIAGRSLTQAGIVTLNKGSVDGVSIGDVATSNGVLVGLVTASENFTSELTLITNPSSNLPVKSADTNLGILRGRGEQALLITQVLQGVDAPQGQEVFTSGLEGDYPPNIFIGSVIRELNDERAGTKQLELSIPLELNLLTEVVILDLQAISESESG